MIIIKKIYVVAWHTILWLTLLGLQAQFALVRLLCKHLRLLDCPCCRVIHVRLLCHSSCCLVNWCAFVMVHMALWYTCMCKNNINLSTVLLF